jgi:hypothetical protein
MKKWFGVCLMAGALMLSGCGTFHSDPSAWKTSGQPEGKLEQDIAACEREAALATVHVDPLLRYGRSQDIFEACMKANS